jgi:hypothetical protein
MGKSPRPKRRHATVDNLRGGLLIGAVSLGLTACGSSGPSSGSYVGRASNAAVYVQWTRKDSKVTGDLNQALLQGSSGQTTVSAESVAFTGVVNGSSITLTLNQGLGSTTNLTGTLHSSRLSLDYPGQNGSVITIPMPSANATAYNTDASLLRQRARLSDVRYADQQAAQQRAGQVSSDAQAVVRDISTMSEAETDATGTSDVNPGLSEMRRDVATTLHDEQHVLAEAGHAASYNLCADADGVSAEADGVQGDLDGLQGDQDASNGDTGGISADVAQLKRDAAVLQADRDSDSGDVPADAPTHQQVQEALSTANAEMTGENGIAGSAMSHGQALYKIAKGYANQAQAACSSAGGG